MILTGRPASLLVYEEFPMKKRIPAAALSLALAASLSLPAAALELEDARALLEQYYVGTIPAAALEAESIEEMLQLLGDPYTVYYTAEEYADFLASINGQVVVGIGVALQNVFIDGFEILSILPDSPAKEAGLKAGDVIIAVDGVTLTAQDNITALLTGEEGSAVTVTVRKANGATKDVTLTRRTVQIPIVNYEQVGSIGYIDCASFGVTAADEVGTALSKLDVATTVWVMDLRNNPGGISDVAAVAAGRFLGSQPMVYYRDGQGYYYVTRTGNLVKDQTDKPLIVLTSANSASAAELFCGAIRDHGAGISIGQRTYGKGVAQSAFDQNSHPELFQGDALKVTTFQFFSPTGTTNHLLGVIPTILLDDPAYTDEAAILLSAAEQASIRDFLKLEIAGFTFYLSPETCREHPQALQQLLEALPPAAKLSTGVGARTWEEITPAQAAKAWKLDFHSRTFPDAVGHPYQREIDTLATYRLIAGGDDGLFHPEQNLTRAQLCVMLAAALNLPAGDTAPAFSDVAPGAWYADAVSAMASKGFVAGTDLGTFRPDDTLTNQELVTILSAVAAWCNMEGYELAQTNIPASQWLEFHAYPEWAQTAARNLTELGVDVDLENPGATVTRGSAAGMLCQLMERMHMLWTD